MCASTGGSGSDHPKTEWDWAKSIHAANGTAIEFRATGSSGATATGSVYIWT